MFEHPQGDDEMTTWYDDEPDGDEDWPPVILDDLLGDDKRCWIPWDEGFDDD